MFSDDSVTADKLDGCDAQGPATRPSWPIIPQSPPKSQPPLAIRPARSTLPSTSVEFSTAAAYACEAELRRHAFPSRSLATRKKPVLRNEEKRTSERGAQCSRRGRSTSGHVRTQERNRSAREVSPSSRARPGVRFNIMVSLASLQPSKHGKTKVCLSDCFEAVGPPSPSARRVARPTPSRRSRKPCDRPDQTLLAKRDPPDAGSRGVLEVAQGSDRHPHG